MKPPSKYVTSLLFFIFFFFSLPSVTISPQPPNTSKYDNDHYLMLESATGPESLEFDCKGKGPYTGVADGRILKWDRPRKTWKDFAYISPNWTKDTCNGYLNYKICGRPLGLRFNKATCDLYIADAYFGLMMVGPDGGNATQLATSAAGVRFSLTDALDVDEETGVVYFTDSTINYDYSEYVLAILLGDNTGRLLKYDPNTKEVTVLINGLLFANGVSLNKKKTFVLVGESTLSRILRYWIKGPKTNTFEVFRQLPGIPDNIKRNKNGEFWVALFFGIPLPDECVNISNQQNFTRNPRFFSRPKGIKLNEKGMVLDELRGSTADQLESITEVHEHRGKLWIGSISRTYVVIYSK